MSLVAAGPVVRPSSQPTEPTHPDKQPSGPTTGPALLETKDYSSSQHSFSLKYPADWAVLKQPVNHQVLSIQTTAEGVVNPDVGVVGLRVLDLNVDPDNAHAKDDQLLKDISGALIGYVFKNGGKHAVIKDGKLGELPGRWIEFVSGTDKAPTRVLYVIAVRNKIQYVFTIAAPEAEFQKMRPDVDAIMKSFKVTD